MKHCKCCHVGQKASLALARKTRSERIKRAYLGGKSLYETAIEVGVSVPTAYAALRDLGVPRRSAGRKAGAEDFTLAKLPAIHQMRSKGASLQAIGDCFGVTREYIRQLLIRYPQETP